MSHTALSKRLAYVLRHAPESIGVTLDAAGWAEVDVLLERLAVTREVLETVVRESPKQRFALSNDGRRIRASQGHSVDVELGYAPAVPPEHLFHGTFAGALAGIRAEGLKKMARHHVHLSGDEETAHKVGARRGKPVILRVAAGAMYRGGAVFYVSANGVWLTEHVPPEHLLFPVDTVR